MCEPVHTIIKNLIWFQSCQCYFFPVHGEKMGVAFKYRFHTFKSFWIMNITIKGLTDLAQNIKILKKNSYLCLCVIHNVLFTTSKFESNMHFSLAFVCSLLSTRYGSEEPVFIVTEWISELRSLKVAASSVYLYFKLSIEINGAYVCRE